MPHPKTDHLAIRDVCNPAEPAVDSWLYTHDLYNGFGPQLAVCSRPSQRLGATVILSTDDLAACLRTWGPQRTAGQPLGGVVLHDGLLTVRPREVRAFSVGELDRIEDAHLCLLDDEDPVEVITWSASIDLDTLPARCPDPAKTASLLTKLLAPDTSQPERPARILLHHLDPDNASLDLAAHLARIGAFGAIQTHHRLGASSVLGPLRAIARGLSVDATEMRALAEESAARWARLLWPPDRADFERGQHRPSVALVHHLEATALALHLYPAVPMTMLNRASMTMMWVLTDGWWGQGASDPQPLVEVVQELTHLPAAAWDTLRTSYQHDAAEDPHVDDAYAVWLGNGLRPPVARDLRFALAPHLAEPVRDRIAAAAADLVVCRGVDVLRTDPLATVLAARSLFGDTPMPPSAPGNPSTPGASA